jgi:DNA-directed RNA polymerase subunit RPC12/RpoP
LVILNFKDVMNDDKLLPLITSQKWKLWVWGGLLAVAGLGLFTPDRFASVLGTQPIVINCVAVLASFIALAGASLSIRCPQCGLSLVWHGISQKNIGGWLSWLLKVRTCPQCGFHISNKERSMN